MRALLLLAALLASACSSPVAPSPSYVTSTPAYGIQPGCTVSPTYPPKLICPGVSPIVVPVPPDAPVVVLR